MASKTEETVAALDEISLDEFTGNEAGRSQAISAARRLLNRLQSPTDRCWELLFDQPIIAGTLQTLKDVGLWGAWAADGGEKSLEELVGMANTGVDINLLRTSRVSHGMDKQFNCIDRSTVSADGRFRRDCRGRRGAI